jgi:hypothetical protein
MRPGKTRAFCLLLALLKTAYAAPPTIVAEAAKLVP